MLTENSNPDVMMVYPAQQRHRHDVTDWLRAAEIRRVLCGPGAPPSRGRWRLPARELEARVVGGFRTTVRNEWLISFSFVYAEHFQPERVLLGFVQDNVPAFNISLRPVALGEID